MARSGTRGPTRYAMRSRTQSTAPTPGRSVQLSAYWMTLALWSRCTDKPRVLAQVQCRGDLPNSFVNSDAFFGVYFSNASHSLADSGRESGCENGCSSVQSHLRSQFNQYQWRLQIRNGIELFYRVLRRHLMALQKRRWKDRYHLSPSRLSHYQARRTFCSS